MQPLAHVYVAVVADGPTRVLYFSDIKDDFTRETEEERFQSLSNKLAALEGEIGEADKQLDELQAVLQQQHGISLELAMAHHCPLDVEPPTAQPSTPEAPTGADGPGQQGVLAAAGAKRATAHKMLRFPLTPHGGALQILSQSRATTGLTAPATLPSAELSRGRPQPARRGAPGRRHWVWSASRK